MEISDIKIFKDPHEAHMKKKNHEVVGDAEIYQLGFSSGIVSALTDIYLKTGGLVNDK